MTFPAPVYRSRALGLYLDPLTVGRVLKKLCMRVAAADVAADRVSGHPLRVDAAQQLTLNGLGILQIMRAGGWRSMNVVARYDENVDLNMWK